MGKGPAAVSDATLIADLPGGAFKPERAADLALGAQLRAYEFERYKTKRKEEEEKSAKVRVKIAVARVAAAENAFVPRAAVANGVVIARDLVNEPANVLYPEEFARRAGGLRKLGVVVDVLDIKEMKKLGMNALLGVGQGSEHESRAVIMRWNGGKRGVAPIAFIGKGVCFDTGGVLIKPAGGMEDMKGDKAGGAPAGGPLHSVRGPTGAGEEPHGPEYDKMIDSKFADMKNTGGRHAGAITAAQFLQRFVDKTPWVHLDIAGTGMGSPQTDINRSWGSGFGVRLLDRLVAEYYER